MTAGTCSRWHYAECVMQWGTTYPIYCLGYLHLLGDLHKTTTINTIQAQTLLHLHVGLILKHPREMLILSNYSDIQVVIL